MGYRLWINNEAKDEIRRLPGHMRQRIRRIIQELSINPRPYVSREMQSPSDTEVELRRIRLDRWRIVYIIDEEWSEIGVLTTRQRPPYDYSDLSELLKNL